MKDKDEKQTDPASRNLLLENVFDNLIIGIAIVSPQLDVLEANHAFYSIYNSSHTAEADGSLKTYDNAFWQKEDVVAVLGSLYESDNYDFEREFEWPLEGDTIKYVKLQSQLLAKGKGQSPQILLTFFDVTETRQNEKTYNLSIRHLMHELRNPLSNISLCVELLADSTKENNQEDTEMFLSKAATSVQRMKQIINDLSAARKATT